MIKILLVEDDLSLSNSIFDFLDDFADVMQVFDGEEGLYEAESGVYDLILLDLMLPEKDGFQVLKELREQGITTPVLIMTAKESLDDKGHGFELGADDYLTKPFSIEELLARLRVTQRRLGVMQQQAVVQSEFRNGKVRVDYAAGCAYLGEKELHLTPIEFKLLCLLAKNIGKVLTHKYITQNIWGSSWENDVASLRVFMATLRKKIECEENSPQYIQTHIGIGYRMLKVDGEGR